MRPEKVIVFFLRVMVILLFGLSAAGVLALDPRYMRNGECYLLLGDLGTHQGVYRLNNPAGDPIFVGRLYNPGGSIGISVDLNRNVYTFSEEVAPGFTAIPGDIPRQVVDGSVTPNVCDWGCHAFEHHDNRAVGQRGRTIYRTPGARRSLGPGTPIAAPGGNPLPPGDTVFGGRSWYNIPNDSWYSTWHTAPGCSGQRFSYKVYRDVAQGRSHTWKLMLWNDALGVGNPPTIGNTIGTSYDMQVSRWILNACLDGCGGATGAPSWPAQPMYTSVAFMPPTLYSQSRTYMYSREKPTSAYSITVAQGAGAPGAYSGPIIGYPGLAGTPVERGTRWIGVSTRDNISEWVYALGTQLIKEWYQAATGFVAPVGMAIDAITVSNQWNQLGGVVYSYDRSSGIVYKFARNETASAPITALGYDALVLGSDIDDIKADGFGSLFFAKTMATPAGADPRPSFNLNSDVIGVIPGTISGGTQWGRAVFSQVFKKEVFERRVTDGTIRAVGDRILGYKYFAYNFQTTPANMIPLQTSPFTGFDTRLLASGGVWLSWGSAAPENLDTYTDPTRTELAVINVPTPPRVLCFPGYNSHLDIIGAYTDFPTPNLAARNTNQGQFLLPATSMLNNGTLYYFMVENYPLSDGAQDPTLQPNWNGAGFMGAPFTGGFISTVLDPRPTSSGGSVDYTWTLWTVQDCYGQDINPLVPHNDLAKSYAFGFYSPVGGKYILTCRVKYDWYNFDLLPYGSVYADRDSVRIRDSFALSQGRANLQANIRANPQFSFISPADLDTMIPDDTYAAFPVLVSTSAPPIPPLDPFIAAIERCDIASDTAATVWTTRANHYVWSNATYAWRISNASQANIFFPNLATQACWLRTELNTAGSPLFANGDVRLQFLDRPGDVRWIDPQVRFTGTIVATMPSSTQSRLPIFGASGQIDSSVATYGTGGIPYPTDPASGSLEIRASRMFAYKVHPYDTVRRIYYPPFEIQKMLTITGRTSVTSLDNAPPALQEDFTNPRNIFGYTNNALRVGDGPAGLTNPANITFMIADDNPFEAGSTNGLTATATFLANRVINNAYNGLSSYNLMPLFARNLNRRTVLRFQSVTGTATHTPGLGFFNTGDTAFQNLYTSMFTPIPSSYLTWGSVNAPGTYSVALGFSTNKTYLRHNLPIINLCLMGTGAAPVNRIPMNYANNQPGYQPYQFEVVVVDSSGNAATYPLNLNLNVRDNIAPIAWATLIERKTNLPRVFPQFDAAVISGLTPVDQGATDSYAMPSITTWIADAAGNFGRAGDFATIVPRPRMLKSLSVDPVPTFADNELVTQIRTLIEPRFIEDNVEFEVFTYVADNAGQATSTLTLDYLSHDGLTELSISCVSSRPWPPAIATGAKAIGVIRGLPNNYFPIACPIAISAVDNAIEWTYRVNSPGLTTNWRTDQPNTLAPLSPTRTPNRRGVLTTLPVYDSRMIIRTLEKSIENR